jgi:Carboxypeptidase regulatory-like domain
MNRVCPFRFYCLLFLMAIATGCSPNSRKTAPPEHVQEAAAPAYQVDPLTAGSISGMIRYIGKRPLPKKIDMSGDPACVEAHHGNALDESLVVSSKGGLANAFVYVKSGLEGKAFATPSTPVAIDQNGCWFRPRVLGIETNQALQITNSDPVTHSIHPMAQINREWNHSQEAGEPPLARKFARPEVMIHVKCNIHSWMQAYIGVVDNPYFAVSGEDGSYRIGNLPPGTYTVAIKQEKLGTQEQQVTVAPHSNTQADVTFKETN